MLRPGGVAVETLEEVLGRELARAAAGPSRAPGMLASHYAPRCRRGGGRRPWRRPRPGCARCTADGPAADVLDGGADVAAYAHHLYAWLRAADERRLDVLVAVLPPAEGVGRAVRDRLAQGRRAPPTVEDAG